MKIVADILKRLLIFGRSFHIYLECKIYNIVLKKMHKKIIRRD